MAAAVAVYSIPLGVQTNIAQNGIYGLPNKPCYVFSSVAVEVSIDKIVWAALTGANTLGASTGGAFLRCPTAAALIFCKRA